MLSETTLTARRSHTGSTSHGFRACTVAHPSFRGSAMFGLFTIPWAVQPDEILVVRIGYGGDVDELAS
jgi:hypothetical protein